MTIANDILFLALRNGGITGIGQTPSAADINDSFKVLNAWINELNLERRVMVNTVVLPTFSDLTTDVSFWSPYEHVLLTSMSVRLRQIYALPPVDLDVQLALSALQAFQAINLQQLPVPPALDPLSVLWILNLGLRAAGRINDKQSVDGGSQDAFDAQYHAVQMIEEWKREREIFVIPGDLPDLSGDIFSPPIGTLGSGVKNAIILNLGVRLQDAFGLPNNSALQTRADKALKLIQAINAQQIAPLATGVPATVRQACVLALRLAGRINDQQRVSDTSTDMNDALSLLVMMLGQWQRKRWLVWNEAETAKVSTGSQWYSVGTGGDFNVPRPDKLHGGFVRFQPFAGPNPVDIPLAIIEAKEDWGKITIKDLKSIPEVMFYDSAFPMGRVTFYPVPPSGLYELHIFTKAQLPVYVHLSDQLLVPPEYLDAIVNNLALRLPGAQITPLLLGQARASLETIRMANAQVSVLSLPGILGGRGGDVSSWSGRGLNRAWIVGSEAVL